GRFSRRSVGCGDGDERESRTSLLDRKASASPNTADILYPFRVGLQQAAGFSWHATAAIRSIVSRTPETTSTCDRSFFPSPSTVTRRPASARRGSCITMTYRLLCNCTSGQDRAGLERGAIGTRTVDRVLSSLPSQRSDPPVTWFGDTGQPTECNLQSSRSLCRAQTRWRRQPRFGSVPLCVGAISSQSPEDQTSAAS